MTYAAIRDFNSCMKFGFSFSFFRVIFRNLFDNFFIGTGATDTIDSNGIGGGGGGVGIEAVAIGIEFRIMSIHLFNFIDLSSVPAHMCSELWINISPGLDFKCSPQFKQIHR